MSDVRLHYFFDPLCGWCYASAPALTLLAQHLPARLELHPCGLFAGQGARAMSADWASHAWTYDQRIASLTGQVFSEAYHQKVLMDPTLRFDSTALTRALTAVRVLDASLEATLLKALQIERYVTGQDTADAQVVAAIVADFLGRHGHDLDADELSQRLLADDVLSEQTRARIGQAQQMMSRWGIQGVPQLVAVVDERTQIIPSQLLYQNPSNLIAELEQTLGVAVA